MQKPEIRYWVLWLFLLGVLVIVFLPVISGYNINRLILGNKRILKELQIQNELRLLQADIPTVESDIRGAVIGGNGAHLSHVDARITAIDRNLASIQQVLKGQVPATQLDSLGQLVHRKSRFSREIVYTFHTRGKSAAASLVTTNVGQEVRDSIIQLVSKLDQARQAKLHDTSTSNEITGRNARVWGIFVTAIALCAVVLAFWYILSQGRQQQKIISLLNEQDKRSREVADMKEQFLANMSHEIRTPMNSILGFTNLLRRTGLTGEQREYVQNIHSAGENLLALVNDILDLSKIEAGMMHIEEVRFSLHSLLSSVGAMLHEKMREKNLNFKVDIDSNVPDILQGDAVRLTQIIVNLLSNAVKFTEKGTIALRIELLENRGQSVRIRLCIADTGIGIAPEKQRTIFERFQQAEAETTRRFGGTGLGLAIVKQLVDLQKGKITLQSTPGKGTKFMVELDYKLPDIEQLYSEALAAAESEPVSLQRIRALIAEDNPMNQQLVRHLMKSWSIDYTIVNNGAEAVAALKKEHYSIVLMDIQMPVMDGYTATSVIRKEISPDIPIIAMTAHAMSGEKEKCLHLGMNDYVSKPIKETVLYNVIARHAQHSAEPAHEPQAQPQPKPQPQSQPLLHHINLDYLHQLSGNDPEFEKQILEQFMEQTPEELAQLVQAIAERDFLAVRKFAHSMKSTVGYVGLADSLHPYLERLEQNASAEKGETMKEDFIQVHDKCLAAMEEIKMLVEKD